MVKYAQNELYSITDFIKQIGSVISSIKEHSLEKIGILKNNKLEAVVISTDEYERLKAFEEDKDKRKRIEKAKNKIQGVLKEDKSWDD